METYMIWLQNTLFHKCITASLITKKVKFARKLWFYTLKFVVRIGFYLKICKKIQMRY